MRKAPAPMFSICHTTARPAGWQKSHRAWLDNAVRPREVEYVLTPEIRADFGSEVPQLRPGMDISAWARGRHCNVDGYNLAASLASGRILIMGADDFFPEPGWDDKMLASIPDLDAEFVIRPSWGAAYDAWLELIDFPNLLVGQILSRKYYERYGYMCYPEFESMAADIDFTDQAYCDGVVIEMPQVVIEHRHFSVDPRAQKDAVYERTNAAARHQHGNAIVARRRAERMARRSGPKKGLVLCTPGASFDWRVHHADMLLAVHLVGRYDFSIVARSCSNQYIVRDLSVMDIRAFMKQTGKKFDYVLWTDSDNVLMPEQFDFLVDVLEYRPEVAAVGGWYYVDTNPPKVCAVNLVHGKEVDVTFDEIQKAVDELRLIEVNGHIGFGAVLMRAEVLLTAGEWAFSPVIADEETGAYLGDDVSFCRRSMARGHRWFLHPEVYLPHLKVNDVHGPRLKRRVETVEPVLDSMSASAPANGNGAELSRGARAVKVLKDLVGV
jgi:Glycosyltransferase like family 2